MGSKSYGYNVRTDRLSVARFPELVVLLVVILVAFWLVFPRNLSETLRNARLDAVSLSYMKAWLRAKPDDYELRILLARELVEQGLYRQASVQMELIPRGPEFGFDAEIAWLELRGDFIQLMAMQPAQRPGSSLYPQTREEIQALDVSQLTAEQADQAAEMAMAMGLVDQAVRFYRQLAAQGQGAEKLHALSARLLLGDGRYQEAAEAHLAAMDASSDYSARRQAFLSALEVLQAGELYAEAVRVMRERDQAFLKDKDVLYRLMNLSLACADVPQAQHYAVLLLRLPGSDR
ncbi:hypothetical protein Y5S_03579 [Alcanivorax nanhaiticus]|uniref:Tetratricopeptide repeat protein n=1 Tax=Alcanivorax nanhaiticus TaxID=1177154 RepID=A0A095UL13_9GAMM|nr:hypothetical protein [Alcanivorax nanhaiticus]KGD63200.1 hypothetical protein Y5S_03579 [Alcanivorax nanhaiticus]